MKTLSTAFMLAPPRLNLIIGIRKAINLYLK